MTATAASGVTIVIPAHNEQEGLGATLQEIISVMSAAQRRYEIIVVDDGSTDATADVARGFDGVRLVQNASNRGYGASLKRGIRAAEYETIVITDGDQTYPNDRIPDLLAKLTDDVDMVVGWRTGPDAKIPWIRRPAKWILGKLAESLAAQPIPDLNSGLRVFRRELAARHLHVLPNGFSFTTTLTLMVISTAGVIAYDPIAYHRRRGASKFRPIKDVAGLTSLIVRSILMFNPLRFFVPAALTCLVAAAVVFFGSLFFLDRVLDATVVLLLVTGFQVLFIGLLADLINRRSPF